MTIFVSFIVQLAPLAEGQRDIVMALRPCMRP